MPAVFCRSAGLERERRSIPQRKLASVLPEPVGAQISVLAPLDIASQPPAWAGVGPSKDASNHRLTGALKGARGSGVWACRREAARAAGGPSSSLGFASVANPPIFRRTNYGVPPANFT